MDNRFPVLTWKKCPAEDQHFSMECVQTGRIFSSASKLEVFCSIKEYEKQYKSFQEFYTTFIEGEK